MFLIFSSLILKANVASTIATNYVGNPTSSSWAFTLKGTVEPGAVVSVSFSWDDGDGTQSGGISATVLSGWTLSDLVSTLLSRAVLVNANSLSYTDGDGFNGVRIRGLTTASGNVTITNTIDSIPNGVPLNYPKGWVRYSQQVMADGGYNMLFNDTAARPKYPMLKITTFDSSIWWWNMAKWQKVAAPSTGFIQYSDSTIVFVTPTQLSDSLGNYVTLYTPQEVKSVKTWDSTQTFMDKVGIGTVPNLPLVVVSGTGKLAYDGIRMTLYDDIDNDNILVGKGTGGSGLTVENIGIGSVALKNVTGSNNIAIGFGNLSSVGTVSRNVAVGVRSLQLSNGDDNTAVGYFAGVTTFGDSNTVVGSEASAAAKLTNTNVTNSDIVIGTNTYSGSDIATFITTNSLTIGQRYSFLLTWNGSIPAPFSTTTTYANGLVQNSNTLQFDISLFTSQGSGTTTLNLYNKQLNSIAIGRKAFTDSSNQISLGNANNTVLKANKFVFDITTTPQNGDVYIYNSALGKFEPASSSSIPSRVVNLTTTQRDALVSPQKGFEIYNITDDVGQMYDGSGTWHNLW